MALVVGSVFFVMRAKSSQIKGRGLEAEQWDRFSSYHVNHRPIKVLVSESNQELHYVKNTS
eukprot:1538799-Amphidinium_carterae.1